MESVSLKNYRCFHSEQKVTLAPLTLLVGENSSGKTSFMAMVRALWKAAYEQVIPDFQESPYDLGSFDEISHHRGGRGGRADTFEAGFEIMNQQRKRLVKFSMVFERIGSTPTPKCRRFESGSCWIEEHRTGTEVRHLRVGSSRGSWQYEYGDGLSIKDLTGSRMLMLLPGFPPGHFIHSDRKNGEFIPLDQSPEITEEDWMASQNLVGTFLSSPYRSVSASAPVRSKPLRTYEPGRTISDPEGDYIPMYLESLYFQSKRKWTSLKESLEKFGQDSGLFDEIEILSLGKRQGAPFQLRIRKFGHASKGPHRNLKDVGYGVSQVLRVVTEVLRQQAPSIFLLQQPEVHLHPRAQAALGSLFLQIAGPDRQLIVETHSDHLLDRVRMDVRDGKGKLTCEVTTQVLGLSSHF